MLRRPLLDRLAGTLLDTGQFIDCSDNAQPRLGSAEISLIDSFGQGALPGNLRAVRRDESLGCPIDFRGFHDISDQGERLFRQRCTLFSLR
jgi:hypothetical protein